MDLRKWNIGYLEGWNVLLHDFPIDVQDRILKKIEQMKEPSQERGLHGSRYCVEEVGQHRIVYIKDNETRTKNICFVGNHKQYEKWYTRFIGFRDEAVKSKLDYEYLRFISLFSKRTHILMNESV